MFEYKTGLGIDVHQLQPQFPLVLGGITIDFDFGLAGHSDGDVLVHAIIDGILGAMTFGDIGSMFPSEDTSLKGIRSMEMLKQVEKARQTTNWQVTHVDATIIAQKPRLSDYIIDMKRSIDSILNIGIDSINLKATTTDHLGFIGDGLGIAAIAVVTIKKQHETI